MAIWKPTALISSIHGSLHGTTFRRRSARFYSSHRRKHKDPRTPRQTTLRRAFSYLATQWHQLSPTNRQLWDDYGQNQARPLTGYNIFTARNLTILAASYSTLLSCATPPTDPETPHHLENLRTFEISETTNAIGWRAPSDPTLFVTLYASIEPGFSWRGKERWSLVETQPTHNGQIIHTHGQPADIPISYRIKITDHAGRQPPPSHISKPYDTPSVYVCDQVPDRVKEYGVPNLELRDSFDAWPGPLTEYKQPIGIALDDYYIYIAFYVDLEIAIYNRLNWKHIQTVITTTQPRYLAVDTTHVYITFPFNDRVEKRLKSDLSLVTFYDPGGAFTVAGVHVDDTYLWLTIPNGHMLHRVTKNDMLFSASYGTPGSGDAQFSWPDGICGDTDNLYIADRGNDRIKKHRKSDWAFQAKNGTTGAGDDQFNWPAGITQTGDYLIISDQNNNRIKVHLRSNLSFVSKAGATGRNLEQFTTPIGVNTLP